MLVIWICIQFVQFVQFVYKLYTIWICIAFSPKIACYSIQIYDLLLSFIAVGKFHQ